MATQPWNDSPPTVDERYQTASSTSNLTVGSGMIPKDHRTPVGDVVAASGMAGGRLRPDGKGGYVLLPPNPASIGMSLLRLHTEWTQCCKPKRVPREVVAKMAEQIRVQDERDKETARRNERPYAVRKPAIERAQDESQRWYSNELRLILTRLKSRGEVLEHLTMWGTMKGIPSDTVAAAVLHWLSPTCAQCDGHGFRFLENQAVRPCGKCQGGERKTDPAVDRVLREIAYALGIARGALRKRLRRG